MERGMRHQPPLLTYYTTSFNISTVEELQIGIIHDNSLQCVKVPAFMRLDIPV
jgi:hypothetical protein